MEGKAEGLMMTHYDTLILGHISKDIIVTPEGEEHPTGGAVVYSSIAARRINTNVMALTKLSREDLSLLNIFNANHVPVVHFFSSQTTSIRNTYLTSDRERRTCEAISSAAPFEINDIPGDIEADLYYLGGLMKGEFPEELIEPLSKLGKVAIDAQGFLRVNENGKLVFRDWPAKKQFIPMLSYLKADAAEAEILTGINNCEKAAQVLSDWGAGEVVVTQNSGVTVCADGKLYTSPFTSRNLTGRTGRGDTCFSAYCNWRKNHSPWASCLFAAALTSLKMEKPGPFSGTVSDVERVIQQRYLN
jgi:sugar/nucleoside kinase (ribokinase family)